MTEEKIDRPSALEEFRREFPIVWKSIPFKGVFVSLLVAWVLLFEYLGNSTFGYIDTHSLYAWTFYSYLNSADDEHGFFIPIIVLALLWWKRNDFKTINAQPWLPALALVAFALFLHVAGFLAQQTRISLAAFYFGVYALVGLVWGWGALKATFFPLCLFVFALPLGTMAETITFPLRLFATTVTGWIASAILGIDVVYRGTMIFDPSGAFQYEVAAACGGLRSLTAVLALCTIFGFMNFQKNRNRVLLILAGFPLAILGNITRLLGIIIVSEAFGQKYGQMVHDNTWFSLLPYIPPIIGIVLLGHWLREQPRADDVEKPEIGSPPQLQATT
ncbi:MAG: exosortase/archaeosortase family protein [Limisphaerales bacterium]